jgi:hypothetical protein
MKNVIDMTRRLKKQAKERAKTEKGAKAPANTPANKQVNAPVIDMTEAREEILSQERRKVKRTILSEFIGAVALVPNKGLVKVTLYDISEGGLAFDIEDKAGHFALSEEVAMRVYLNHQTYFGFVVKVVNFRFVEEEKVFRHGVNFVKGTINDEALFHFVKFIETVSASLHGDAGDIMVSNLTR